MSELGRFNFAVYANEGEKAQSFAKQVGKSAYKTIGYKEISLYDGACKSTYSHIRGQITRQWRQPKSLATSKLQNEVVQESKKITVQLEQQSQEIFSAAGFNADGKPIEEQAKRKWEHLPLKELQEAKKSY